MKKRLNYQPQIPEELKELDKVCFKKLKTPPISQEIQNLFPHTCKTPTYQLEKGTGRSRKVKIGVLFSGGPASGGHNVITGLFDAGAELIGFLGGSSGLIENKAKPIQDVSLYRNQGGFDLLGTGRTKIETEEQLKACLQAAHALDGLVIIGGDDSNTNAAILAEYFLEHRSSTCVIGVPKTIDGDLRSDDIEISFGFDTATKTYSELIGNICKDALSTRKYYHFIKLMGRSASHIALECALSTHPNVTLISEERRPLEQIVKELADLICRRYETGKEYGVVLIPEGLVEFLPELNQLDVPRDPHGNIQVSQIETEKFLLDLVKKELTARQFKGKFSAQQHFFGYEGRCALPTNFDANYGYALGRLAFLGVREQLTGVICAIQRLKKAPKEWTMRLVPIVSLLHLEERKGKRIPVIQKALVDLKGHDYLQFAAQRKKWEMDDDYECPGPIQF